MPMLLEQLAEAQLQARVTVCFRRFPLQRIGSLKGRINLDSVRAVELVDESAFRLAHSLQVRLQDCYCMLNNVRN